MEGSTTKTILLVEDDRRISEALCKYLRKHGFECLPILEGGKVPAYLSRGDLLLLDLNLPDMDGLEVLGKLRQESRIPVLIMSARGESQQRILGLNLGADDYLVKPVLPGELLARVNALFRRSEMTESTQLKKLSLDEKARIAKGPGGEVSLTEHEFGVLRIMSESPGQAFTRKELLQAVWGEGTGERTRRVDLAVSRIRTKFADLQMDSPIESVWKVGYRYKEA